MPGRNNLHIGGDVLDSDRVIPSPRITITFYNPVITFVSLVAISKAADLLVA